MLIPFPLVDKAIMGVFIGTMFRRLAATLALLIILGSQTALADYRTFGILGGASFPKGLFAQFELNFAENLAIDYEPSISVFWSIQQADILYFFNRNEWCPYLGAGFQNWNFYGFSGSTNYNGVLFGTGNSASAVDVPLGLQFVAGNGFAVDLRVGIDVFVSAPLDLKGRLIPEGELSLGFFF